MNLASSLIVVIATLAVIAWLIVRPGRWLSRPRLAKHERQRLAEALPWWDDLDSRVRQRLLTRVAAVRDEIVIIGGNGLSLSRDQRLLVTGMIALASLGADTSARRLPDDCIVYRQRPSDIEPVPLPDLLEDLGELASGADWQAQRLLLSWPQFAGALAGGAANPLVRGLTAWRMAQPAADTGGVADWSKTLEAAMHSAQDRTATSLALPFDEEPAVFAGALAEAFFQQGAVLRREWPTFYDLMAAYFDFDTAPRQPAGHRTPDSGSAGA